MKSPISADQATFVGDMQSLSKLKQQARQQDSAALKEVARQFEALFIQQVLKSMREATPEGGLFDSNQSRFYRDMFDQQMGVTLSRGRGLGLADALERQLAHLLPGAGKTGADPQGDALSMPSLPAATGAHQPDPELARSPAAFVRALWPHAEEAAVALGTDPKVLLAQAALESGWGKSLIHDAGGNNSYNLFGIKVSGPWRGDSVRTMTTEFDEAGAMHRETARFRRYADYQESFQDLAIFLKVNPRYEDALQLSADPRAFVRGLQQAGYATDPDYADKIISVMQGPVFQDAVAAVKDFEYWTML